MDRAGFSLSTRIKREKRARLRQTKRSEGSADLLSKVRAASRLAFLLLPCPPNSIWLILILCRACAAFSLRPLLLRDCMHWHAIMYPPHPLSISQVFKAVKVSSTIAVNVHLGEGGELWQAPFFRPSLALGQGLS